MTRRGTDCGTELGAESGTVGNNAANGHQQEEVVSVQSAAEGDVGRGDGFRRWQSELQAQGNLVSCK